MLASPLSEPSHNCKSALYATRVLSALTTSAAALVFVLPFQVVPSIADDGIDGYDLDLTAVVGGLDVI